MTGTMISRSPFPVPMPRAKPSSDEVPGLREMTDRVLTHEGWTLEEIARLDAGPFHHALFVTVARLRPDLGWRAHHHDDGTMFPDYFIAGLRLPAGQVNYHLPLTHWAELDCLPVYDRAPAWDGHTPNDAIARLLAWHPEDAWLAIPHQSTRIAADQ